MTIRRLSIPLLTAFVLFLLCHANTALAASSWDFTENWDSGYTDNQVIPATGSPWSSSSTYGSMNGAGAHADTYNRKSGSYSAHLGYWTYGSFSYYDFYLKRTFSTATAGAGTLKFWYYLAYSTLYVQHSSDGSTWTNITIKSSRQYVFGAWATVTIPANTKYIRFKANTDPYYFDGAWIDDISFTVPEVWVNEITGFDPDNPNGGILELTADAGGLTGYEPTSVEWQYKKTGDTDWTDLPTDTDGSDGWTVSIDTRSFSDIAFKVRARALSGSKVSKWCEVTINVQNLIFDGFTLPAEPMGGVIDIAASATPPTLSVVYPPNPWTFNGSVTYYYSYTDCVDATEGIPIGGTATKFTSEFSRVYSTSSSYYYKFKLWQRGAGKTYTLIASTGTLNYQTGVVEHTLTGSQWTNLPAGLYIGGYFYRGYIYYYSGAPYSGNGDRSYYYYSSERTGTFSSWRGPSSYFAIPFRVWMSGAGASASDVKFRYRIGEDGDPVDLENPYYSAADGLWHVNWESWAFDSDQVYFEVSFFNGHWSEWHTTGPHVVRNRIDLTFQTQFGDQVPGPGVIVVDGEDVPSGDSKEYLYYQDVEISAPQYQFDDNGKRWRWDHWNDGGGRTHTISTEPGMDTVYTAFYLRQYSYTIDSLRPDYSGTPPGWYDPGFEVTCTAERFSIEVEGQVRYECKGYEIPELGISGSALTVTFTLDRDLTLRWIWEAQYYFESVNDYNAGTGSLPGWYPEGTEISYTVAQSIPNGENARLRCGGYYIGDVLTPDVNAFSTRIDSYIRLEWTWVQQFFFKAATNVGTIAPEEGWYDEGTEIEVVATPPPSDDQKRYTFLRWDGVGAGVVRREGGEPVADVTVNSPIEQYAWWLVEYRLTLLSDNGTFDPDASGWYPEGTEVTINAVPPAAGEGSRYLPEWSSESEGGLNVEATEDAPASDSVVMDNPIVQRVDWRLQHRLTIINPNEDAVCWPAAGSYWYFAGDVVYGFCRYVNSDKVCSGFAGTGSYPSSGEPWFRGPINASSTVTWEFRDRAALPAFGLEDPAAMGSDGGPVSMRTAPDGTPTAVFRNTAGELVYARFVSGAWNTAIIAHNVPATDWISHAFDRAGFPVVAYYDPDALDAVLVYNPPLQVETSEDYVSLRIETEGNDGINPHVACSETGTIYITFYAAAGRLVLATVPTWGVFQVETIVEEGNAGFYNDIGMDPTIDEPVVVYFDAFSLKFVLMRQFHGEWFPTVISEGRKVGVECALRVGRNGELYVAYRDESRADQSKLLFLHVFMDEIHRYKVDVDSNSGRGLSLDLGPDDYPNILYYGPDSLKLARYNGTAWEIYTLKRGIAPSGRTAVALKPDGKGVFFYKDGASSEYIEAGEGAIRPDNVSAGSVGSTGWVTTSAGGGGCFVATAAFGAMGADSVLALTAFRDRSLCASLEGSSLVGLYYALSPSVAARTSPHLRAFLRRLLDTR